MTFQRFGFLDRYNAVEVPNSPVSRYAPRAEVREVAATFFNNIKSSLDLSQFTLELCFRHDMPKEEFEIFRSIGGPVLALAVYKSDESDRETAHFARLPLVRSIQVAIDELQQLERTVDSLG